MEEGFFENFKAISTDMDNINFQRFATITDYNGDTFKVREEGDDSIEHSNVLSFSNVPCKVGDKVVIGFVDNSIYNPVIIGNFSRGVLEDIHTDEIIEDYELENIGTSSGANQSEINQAIDAMIGFSETDGDYYFTLDSFFDPNQWTGNPTIRNGKIILVEDSSFPLRLPPNCKLTFEFYLGTLTYDVGDTFTFKIFGRNISYTLTQHDEFHGVAIDVSLDCYENVCVFESDKTGDTLNINNVSSYKGLFVQVKNSIPVIIRNIVFDDNSITVDDELSTTSINPVQNKVISNALNAKSDINHNHNDIYYTESETDTLLNNKANTNHNHTASDITNFPSLATVATTGDYDDLTNKPNIPTKTSDLTNDGDGTNVFVKDNDTRLSDARTPLSHTHDDRYYTELDVDGLLSLKQDTLVSGTSIKTINNQSLLGSGNINIQGGGTITVDDSLSNVSENPVQNKVINAALSIKAPIYHASPNTTYGLGDTTDYGHVKIVNDLNEIGYSDGLVLSAYQGAVLKDLIDAKSDFSGDYSDLTGKPDIVFLELISSDYTPDINDNFTLTLKATDIFGNPVSNYNAGTLKENGYNVYDTNRNQIGANVITDSNGEWSATIPCYNLQSEIYLQNNNSEAMLWSLRDYSVGDSHCQVQAEGWYFYRNESTYKLSRNGYLARFSLHGWSTGTVLTTTSWTNFGGSTAYAANIIPTSHVIMVNSGCNTYFRINTNGTIVCRAVSSNVASGTAQYGMVTWSCEK